MRLRDHVAKCVLAHSLGNETGAMKRGQLLNLDKMWKRGQLLNLDKMWASRRGLFLWRLGFHVFLPFAVQVAVFSKAFRNALHRI